ncbi:MAG: Uma2 family endonuclease [Oscillatoriaceae bacterium SKW80]|nr:Uma2 family endonuclease [Oscillatoriaceae bacterium SKYG93]MCX8120908.1 Uma2 family endonuclease [Oscillatoriaceae bacterium SKW80]MDW8452181.1 Uma2 family endonuclease [Oscillatoriaceae cyanobacterium SKYGB_i_bin93]HIK26519.1 Uma2 family endonuclease [Oscillatoriaceae cyanobacterium M7585_C2015_266]
MLSEQQSVNKKEIIYPESDGLPMAENTEQFKWIVTIKENLELLFADRADVFVAGDLLWYPVEGNNKIRQAPDTMVVFGRPKGRRGSYQQWREDNIAPQVVFEILSPGNSLLEMIKKLRFYECYGVEEYYIYEPDKVELTVFLREGERLETVEEIANWVSPRLGIRFDTSGEELEIYRPDGEKFLTFVELGLARERERQRAEEAEALLQQERSRREALEARLREMGINPEQI